MQNMTNVSEALWNMSVFKETLKMEVVGTFYSIFLIVGFLGNMIVILAMVRFEKFRCQSIANGYILNLAFADMLFILTMPFFIASTNKNWVMNSALCKMANFAKELNKFASVFTLVVLSFDRYLASFPNREV